MSFPLRRLVAALVLIPAIWIAPLHVRADGVAPPLRLAVTVDRIAARDDRGERLGTLVLPAIVAGRGAGAARPLLVVFNGGPGAGSAWLQLGLLGPDHAVLPPGGGPPHLEPNRAGLWPLADLLFVDPLDTGFSRTGPGVDPARGREWRADGAYLARAIMAWMARHDRRDAPVVLIGESYGTERAIAVGEALQSAAVPVRLAAMVLVSQTVLSESGLRAGHPRLATAIGLPTMAATACHFGRAAATQGADPLTCAEQAWRIASGTYLADRPADDLRPMLAGLAGVPETTFDGPALLLSRDRYRTVALGDGAQVLGRYDSRLHAPLLCRQRWQDPSLDPLLPPMTAMARLAARQDYGLAASPLDHRPYVLYDPSIGCGWRYGPGAPASGTPAMARRLAGVLARSGATLLVAGGVFDTVGSYGADHWLVRALRLPPGRAQVISYPGGHMFYLDDRNRADFLARLRAMAAAIGNGQPSTAT